MLKKIIIFLLIFYSHTFASVLTMHERIWEKGDSFLYFLQKNNIPLSIYNKLDREDQELTAEIYAGIKYHLLKNENDEIEQILIPISDDLQIHIYKDKKGEYAVTFTQIEYEPIEAVLTLKLQRSVYQDVSDAVSSKVAKALLVAFSNSIDFKIAQKNDNVAILYTQNIRLGQLFGELKIKAAMVEINKYPNYIYRYKDLGFFDKNARQLEDYFFILPVGDARISSPFSKGRFHPILKKYRAHLGIDYARPTGYPVKVAGSGKITFKGSLPGYGNVVKVQHQDGYLTLYAHLSRFGAIHVGQFVKQGQVIAYVGSTGMSTGPHLHFGMYKNGVAINPASIVKVTKKALYGNDKREFDSQKADYDAQIKRAINEQNPSKKFMPFDLIVPLESEDVNIQYNQTYEEN